MIRVDCVNMTCVYMFCDYLPMGDMAERLRQARIGAGYRSARSAALRFAWKESTYAAHENGQNDYDPKAAESYGRAFKVPAAWLLTGEGTPKKANIVRVMGFIGAGAEISPDSEQVPHEGLAEIEVPFPISEGTIAFEVKGESMWPRYDDGDIIICSSYGSQIDRVLGWEAAVKTSDGRRYLKRILRGATSGVFDLESHNAPPMRSQKLDWIGEVLGVVRSGKWRALTDAGKKKTVRRMVG